VDNTTTTRKAYEVINAGNLDGLGDLLADDFVEHEQLPGFAPTKQGTLDWFHALLTAFPDMRMDVEDLIASDDKAVARVTATATHRGEFMGIPATGKSITMELIDIMKFDDSGRLGEHWGVADMMALMRQLGVMSAGPPA
jgi:steroid delta-isomerase-like uncharacterized protein